MLRYLPEALSLNETFSESHLNSFQLEILEELLQKLGLKFERNILAATQLAYPDLALDKFSGTDPDQVVESFIQLVEGKVNFAPGDALANLDAVAN